MNISSTTSSTAPAPRLHRHGRMAAAGVVTVALLAALGIWWPSDNEQVPQEDSSTATRPLFAGWIQPGHSNFGPAGHEPAPGVPQPRWVLATEPSEQEIQAIESTLADHQDKDGELTRLVDHSRFQKRIALWNELQNGPMNSERATLGQHLLKVLPDHYSRGELLGRQALMMAKALIQDLEPNPQLQHTRLAEAKSELEKQAPIIDQSELAAQSAAESFQQQQKPTPAAHDAEPVEPTNTLQLEARADTSRRSLLDASSATLTR